MYLAPPKRIGNSFLSHRFQNIEARPFANRITSEETGMNSFNTEFELLYA